jgi:hypothetical protein
MVLSTRLHRYGAALLSAVLLAGTVLPAVQHVCASMHGMADAPEAMMHGADAPSGDAHGHDAHVDHSPAPMAVVHDPASHEGDHSGPATHDCIEPCLDGCSCTVQSAPVDVPDLRTPDRGPSEEAALLQPVTDRTAVPAPVSSERPRLARESFSSPSAVRLHIWTATFLT